MSYHDSIAKQASPYTGFAGKRPPLRKAPLISMRGMVNILIEDHLAELKEDARLYVNRIAVNGEKLHNLINELLAFSRVGRVHNEQEWVDLNQVVVEVLDQLAHIVMERQAQVEIEGPLPVVYASRIRMSQLFLKLINNAIKYTPQERSPRIQIVAQERPDAWEITVQDNGIGIPHPYQDKIFGLFQRLPEAKLLNPAGTGYDLPLHTAEA